MREILFRGKGDTRYNDGDWYYGVPIQDRDWDWQICNGFSNRTVLPETIGEFTGLTDKNGTKIFEGDILKYINEDDEPHYITVVFDECAFLIDDQGIIDCDLLTSYTVLGLEVVGNVFDNPELLGGEDNG